MITLYGFSPAFGLPDLSPFVLKAATALRMAGVKYESQAADPRKAPKGKLPYITDDGQPIADSSFIVEHLRKKYKDLDEGLSPQDRAVARAFQSMLESDLYFITLTLRWVDDRGWAVFEPMMQQFVKKGGAPGFLAGFIGGQIRKQVIKTAKAQGMGRHSISEVEDMGVRIIEALSEFLGDKPYILGDKPRYLDASVFGNLWLILDAPFDNRVQQAAKARPNLVAYRDRMREKFWKD
jgi:glutathione S-transferase